ncbi:MAG: DUF2442 domain-containing protein [Firmicutes bacterium]|nr:DUF2442 domain-containing protein [Bacillota bacterium]
MRYGAIKSIYVLTAVTWTASLYKAHRIYASLQDAEIFNDVRIEGSTISWVDGAIDIAPETLYEQSVPYECQAWA